LKKFVGMCNFYPCNSDIDMERENDDKS